MPTLAQITKALADKIRSVKQRRRDVYDEANRLVELAPFREKFLPLEEGEFYGYQMSNPVAGQVVGQENRAGAWGVFAGGVSGPDHRFELCFNFRKGELPVSKVIKSIYVRAVDNAGAAWSTVDSGLFPVVCFLPGSTTPLRTSYGEPVATLSGNATLECFIDINALNPTATTWFPLRVIVEIEGEGFKTIEFPYSGVAPIYKTFPSTHVKERFDAQWLGQKSDTQYPKAFVILDDGSQKLQPMQRSIRKTSFLVMFVCKQGPLNEDGSPAVNADASFGWPYGDEAEQISRFINDFDLALKADDTLGGKVMEARMEGFVSDSGLAHPEGAVWIKVEVEYHA